MASDADVMEFNCSRHWLCILFFFSCSHFSEHNKSRASENVFIQMNCSKRKCIKSESISRYFFKCHRSNSPQVWRISGARLNIQIVGILPLNYRNGIISWENFFLKNKKITQAAHHPSLNPIILRLVNIRSYFHRVIHTQHQFFRVHLHRLSRIKCISTLLMLIQQLTSSAPSLSLD